MFTTFYTFWYLWNWDICLLYSWSTLSCYLSKSENPVLCDAHAEKILTSVRTPSHWAKNIRFDAASMCRGGGGGGGVGGCRFDAASMCRGGGGGGWGVGGWGGGGVGVGGGGVGGGWGGHLFWNSTMIATIQSLHSKRNCMRVCSLFGKISLFEFIFCDETYMSTALWVIKCAVLVTSIFVSL